MHETNEMALKLIEEVVSTVETVISDMSKRISALEAETGVEILRDFDEDKTDWRHNQLAVVGGGGLKQWNARTKTWRVVTNGVEAVTYDNGFICVERTDGTIEKTPLPLPGRKKAA